MLISWPGQLADGSTVQVEAERYADGSIAFVGARAPLTVEPMLVGVNAGPEGQSSSEALAAHLKLFPGMRHTRIFAAAGKGIPSWTGTTMAAVPHSVVPHVSFKDFSLSALQAWLDAMPADRPEVWVTYFHEPENNGLDPKLFVSRWKALVDLVQAHRNRSRVKAIPVLTQYWARHKGDWHTWWPGVGDGIGWDCYNEVALTTYEDPAKFLAVPLASARELGVPLHVPELGAITTVSDPGGSARAAWMATVADVLRSAGCKQVSWWCGTGTNGKSYHLDSNTAGLQMWNAIIDRSAR